MSHEIKSHEKLKRLKFGTKTSLLGYFNAGFWTKLLLYLKLTLLISASEKRKRKKDKFKNKISNLFVTCKLEFEERPTIFLYLKPAILTFQ